MDINKSVSSKCKCVIQYNVLAIPLPIITIHVDRCAQLKSFLFYLQLTQSLSQHLSFQGTSATGYLALIIFSFE